jgi:xylose isomerase
MFPSDIKKTTLVMKTIMEQGGLAPGGLNFDCKVRRESTELRDMFIAHIGAMDAFARGLRIAARIINDNRLPAMVAERYSSFDSGFGKKIEKGEATLEDCEAYVKENGEPQQKSARAEEYEMIMNHYV